MFPNIFGTFTLPPQTVAFGTAIVFHIPPRQLGRTKLRRFKYSSGGANSHTLLYWSSFSRTTLTVAAAGSATTLILKRDPGAYAGLFATQGLPGLPAVADNPIASGDSVVLKLANGETQLLAVSAATTNTDNTCTITVGAIKPCGAQAGADVWFFGATAGTDSDPKTGNAPGSEAYALAAEKQFGSENGSVIVSHDINDPIMMRSSNATSTGIFSDIAGTYEI